MKLSAIFISVNLAATIPLSAQAADGIVTENVSWLKDSLVSIEKAKNRPTRKLSLSELGQPKTAARMMPFVPNRPLPSEKDLLLAAQQTGPNQSANPYSTQIQQQSESSDKSLASQVSDYAGQLFINSKRTPLSSPAGPTPRVIPGQRPTLPGQIAANRPTGPAIPVIPEPPGVVISPASATNIDPYQFAQLSHKGNNALVEAPVLTPEERAMMRQLIELTEAGKAPQANTLGNPEHISSAGPAPFPLNLLPQDSLKQFIGHRKNKISAPPAYFGSWHQGMKVSGLPAGGFQSHLVKHKISAAKASRKVAMYKTATSKTTIAHNDMHRSTHSSMLALESGKIATYPPYAISNKVMTF